VPKMGRAILSFVLLLIAACCGYFALATMEMPRESWWAGWTIREAPTARGKPRASRMRGRGMIGGAKRRSEQACSDPSSILRAVRIVFVPAMPESPKLVSEKSWFGASGQRFQVPIHPQPGSK
jgi:hypothetical protein